MAFLIFLNTLYELNEKQNKYLAIKDIVNIWVNTFWW